MTTAKNYRCIDPQVQHQFGEAGTEQDIDQNVVKLGQKSYERSTLLALRQPIGSVLPQAARGLGRLQAFVVAGTELLYHLIGCHGVPEGNIVSRFDFRGGVHSHRAPVMCP